MPVLTRQVSLDQGFSDCDGPGVPATEAFSLENSTGRSILKSLAAALLLAGGAAGLAATASAQVFGQLTTAEVLPLSGHMVGAYAHFSSNSFGLLSQLRLSLYPGIDFGFMGGLTRTDQLDSETTTLRMGADVKFAVAKAGDLSPVDLAIGGALGIETGNDISVQTLGPVVVASRAFPVGTAAAAPYLGLGLLFSNIDIDNFEDADFAFPIRAGCEFRFAPEFRVGAELQLRVGDEFNDDVAFVTGVNLPF